MKRHYLFCFFFILILNSLYYPQTSSLNIEYQTILKEILNISPISVATIPDGGLEIQKDSAVFKLSDGEIFRFSNIAGAERILLFKGKGQFNFSPPTKVEKEHLARFFEKQSLNEEFNYLVLLFTDSSNLNLVNSLKFSKQSDLAPVKKELQKFISYISDDDAGYFYSNFMNAMMNHHSNSLFYAHIGLINNGPVFFEITPYDREEVTFMKKAKTGFVVSEELEVINSYPLQHQESNQQIFKEDVIKISNYNIHSRIENNLDFSAKCEINFDRKLTNSDWIKFSLYYKLTVDSVLIDNKKTNDFYRGKENPELWIKLNPQTPNKSLTVYYKGDLLERNELGWIALKSPNYWFPKYSYRDNVLYDLTFSYSNELTLASIGKKESENESDDFITSRWKSVEPSHGASFNIGNFEKYELADKKDNKVNVFISKAGHRQLAHALAEYGELSGSDMDEKIATDILGCMEFYKGIIGPLPLNEIQVTEIPYLHGEAFPGLVHLSWLNYQGVDYDKAGELFRAHEVAHQWWGIGVDFDSYHDQWLSEGFAEYSALWFVQAAFKDNEAFFKILDKWKDNIFSNRQFLFSSGQQAGPICLGFRTNSEETAGDYDLIIYEKGAWVLHMLRNLLIDLKTMNEDAFKNMIQEYYKTYYGKKATTLDLKKIADKYCKQDMSWFFNQFVYGTDLPSYTFSYKTEKTPEGKVLVTCKVKQENVSDDFKMYVPIKILLSQDRYARVRVEIKGKESTFKLPLLPEEPEEIIFNDLNSVLCKVDNNDWEE